MPKKIVDAAGKATAIRKRCTVIYSCLMEFKICERGPAMNIEIIVLDNIVTNIICLDEVANL